ncbi:MAG: hypothetical protein ABW321_06065 [Polyangiales bacterium]
MNRLRLVVPVVSLALAAPAFAQAPAEAPPSAATARADEPGPGTEPAPVDGEHVEAAADGGQGASHIGAASHADVELEPPALVGDSFGDHGGGLRAGFLLFRFMMQARYTRTFAEPSTNPSASYRVAENELARNGDGANIHRFFVRIAADPLPYLQLKTIVDLAELIHDNPDSAVKQAFVELKPIPKRLELTFGLFKVPYSILELDPVAEFPFAELGQADDLVKELGFAGRDIGAEVTIAPLPKRKWLRVAFGAFRGHAKDESKAVVGTLGARLETRPFKGLRIGVDWVEHPSTIVYNNALETSNRDLVPNPADLRYPRARTWSSGRAGSADVRYHRHHWRLAVEGMLGKRIDVDTRYGAGSFIAFWGLAGYRFRLAGMHCMPALRAAWSDFDREHPVGVRRELSVALNMDFTDHVRLLIDGTRSDVQSNSPRLRQPKPLPETPYMQLADTRLVAQLQVTL